MIRPTPSRAPADHGALDAVGGVRAVHAALRAPPHPRGHVRHRDVGGAPARGLPGQSPGQADQGDHDFSVG